MTGKHILTDVERHKLLWEWNNTKINYPFVPQGVHQLFEAQVEQSPDAVAIVFEDKILTYRELNQRANQLSHYLRTMGVGPETLVGICVERSIEMAVGILGILKAGGAYVPLDPAYPVERLKFMIENTRLAILLTQERLQTRLPGHAAKVVYLDTNRDILAQESANPPVSNVSSDNPAYVIYTSGSTGSPKGVTVPHRAVIDRLLWMQTIYQLTNRDRVLQKASFSFDVAVWELLLPLSVGGQSIIARPGGQRDSNYLVKLIVRQQITAAHFVPSMLNLFLEADGLQKCHSLRFVLSGGEVLSASLKDIFLTRMETDLHNQYGQTETCIDVLYWLCQRDSDLDIVPLGRPYGNTQIYILDTQLQPVPIGEAGEIYVGGSGLARGYFNRPALTAERFIPNPFSDEPGQRLYKTGDLARYLPDGNVQFLGRTDHQVKIRGFRVELGEIETALSQHPGVRETVIIARDGVLGQKHLVAYVVLNSEHFLTISDVRNFLQKKLPDPMLPAALVLLEALPLTPNGKVDRHALPAPDTVRPELAETYVPPRTQSEMMLADIWADLLGIDQVGIYDNFFELGGDSITGLQIVSRAIRAGLQLTIQQIFEQPTIAELAAVAEQLSILEAEQDSVRRIVPSTPSQRQPVSDNIEAGYPLSSMQQGILFHTLYTPHSTVYFNQKIITLRGKLNVPVFKQAWQQVVGRHQPLRTLFEWERQDEPLQIVLRQVALPWQEYHLEELPVSEQEKQLEAWLQTDQNQGFDLTKPPLTRLALFQITESAYQLVWSFHHILLDGWSTSLILNEVFSLYNALDKGQDVELDPSRPYRDYIAWLQEQDLSAPELFWRQALQGFTSPTPLGIDQASTEMLKSPTGEGQDYAEQWFQVPSTTTTALLASTRQHALTLNTLFQGVWGILLSYYSGADDVVFGTTVSGRPADLEGVESMVGLFINTLPVRLLVSPRESLPSWLQGLQKQQLVMYRYDYTALTEIQTWSDVPQQLPLFESLLVFENYPHNLPSTNSAPAKPEEYVEISSIRDLERTNYPLVVVVMPREELSIQVIYNRRRFDPAAITRLGGHLQTLLESIAHDFEQNLADLSPLTETEQHQLLVEWNDTCTNYPQDQCIHQLFEIQAKQTPEATAIVFENKSLTYEELNHRANQLAHYLRKLGVEAEIPVGVFMERSLEMVVGILGILKAGGVYVPLNPSYPKELLQFMLEDVQTSILLTQEDLTEKILGSKAQLLYLDSGWQTFSVESEENLVCRTTADSLAYIMYTSGSTGKPKGTSIMHQSVVRLVKETDYANFSADERFLQMAPISFDAATLELWAPLLNGGQLVIFPAHAPSFSELAQAIKKYRITTLWLTAGLFDRMVETELESLNSVRQLLAGGDVLSVSRVRKALEQRTVGCLINGYGPTENTTFTCCYPMTHTNQVGNSVPIGRPIANTQVYILNRHLYPVPIGVPGELYIGGDGLAREYWNRPKLTAERFLPNPFSDKPGARLYKTGDLVRYRPDGNIEFLGRVDYQVKIRGFRVEPGEIEVVLNQHPMMQETIVIAREDIPGDKHLVAYIVPRQENSLSVPELRRYVQEKLPDYMVPSAFVILDTLPLTSNGKVDRQALPAPDPSQRQIENEFVPPQTDTQKTLANIWGDVLGLEMVGIHDNFFELGGHSLLATQVVSRLQKAFQLNLPLRSLFEAPTVFELARHIETVRWAGQNNPTPSGTDSSQHEEIVL